jgi:DNA modification methylase
MKVIDQKITDNYAIYNSDCLEVLPGIPSKQIHLSIYSPPFCGLFHYSSSERDMSNCRSYAEFMENYEFLVNEIHRVTMNGRITAVHCMDVPDNGANLGGNLIDFPGDIIRMHQKLGFDYAGRHCVWKEPLDVRNRTMAKGLAHRQVVEDSSLCDNAGADYLLIFRKKGTNPIPIAHPEGLMTYAGERQIPTEALKFKGWKGKQTENKYSHWIWRQYASAFWDDVRLSRTLKYKEARDPEDERHMHPLQLDVIERCVILRSNPGETVLTPFMGVGSEVAGTVMNGRRGVGVELKNSYFRQAVKNLEEIEKKMANKDTEQTQSMFDMLEDDDAPQEEDEE